MLVSVGTSWSELSPADESDVPPESQAPDVFGDDQDAHGVVVRAPNCRADDQRKLGQLPQVARGLVAEDTAVRLSFAQEHLALDYDGARGRVEKIEEPRCRIARLDDLEGDDVDPFDPLSFRVVVDGRPQPGHGFVDGGRSKCE